MSSSTASALRQPQNLTELLDGRPDTREMISANLNLAHACLLLKQGEAEEVERALELAQRTRSTGLESITRCVRAEVLRVTGKTEEAWDMAEALVQENRFDTVAALYLRFLFPFRPVASQHEKPETPAEAPATVATLGESEFVAQKWDEDPPAPAAAAPAPAVESDEAGAASLADSAAVSVVDHESEVSLDLDLPAPVAAQDSQTAPRTTGQLPAVLEKISQDTAIRLLRVREPDGTVSESVRVFPSAHEHIEEALVQRPAQILKALGFGSLAHASFEHATGAAHSWIRKGRTLVLVVEGTTSAPALAARCTRAMEES